MIVKDVGINCDILKINRLNCYTHRDRDNHHTERTVNMASFELREPKKKPRYYKLIANVLVNGKIERRYGRFDFDPTELKNARARNAAAKAAAAEFERQEQEKADKEASNAGKTFAVVAQEYIESKKARLAPSARLEGDYDSHRNKANTTRGKENYLRKIRQFPEFAQKPVGSIKKVDCDWVLEQIEIGGARCRTHAVINQRGLEMKKESCPKLAKRCDCGAKTIEKAFRSETVDIKTAEQVAIALGCKVDDAFDVETIARPMTRKSMREYALFIRSTLEYADENYGVKNPMHKIPALGSRSRSVDTIKKHQIKQLQDTLKESSMLEQVIVLSLLNSGVRRGELAGLTWKDVNFEECTIHISKSLLVFKDFGYQLTTTKESNIRDVDVAPEYMDFLKEYYKYWKSQKKLMGGSWQKSLDKKSSKYAPSLLALRGTDFVICNDHGFPINPDSYGALVRRIGQRAGIEGLHPHMFRHTFVSILLSNPEIGVATVAAEAGHAQPSTTLAIYTQVYDKRRKEIRNQMSKELYE